MTNKGSNKPQVGKPRPGQKLISFSATAREITHLPMLYTWGYQSRDLEELQAIVMNHGIKRVIDVRRKPWSKYQPDFRKERLSQFSWYEHYEILGNEHKELPWLKGDHWHTGVKAVANLLKQHPVLLMCLERNPDHCHRKEVAAAIFHEVKCQIEHLGFVRPVEQMNLL